jgi:hypothetical protein
MQAPTISKLFPAICALIFCSSLMAVRADDTPDQAAARTALIQKMNEMPAQPSVPPPVVVTPATPTVEAPAPVVVAPPVAPALAPALASNTEMFLPTPAPNMNTSPTLDNDAQAKARAALLKKMSELGDQSAATPPSAQEKVVIQKSPTPAAAAPVAAPAVMEPKPAMVAEPMVKPIETPALPISETKEERLQALLEKYKADQITPEEYHTERAKIIGEP